MNAEHADLEARFAAPAERDLPAGRHDLHREILMNHMLSQPPAREAAKHNASGAATHGGRGPRRMRGRLLAAAAGLAIAAGLAGYAITAGGAPAVPKTTAAPPRPAAGQSAAGQSGPGAVTRQTVLAAKILRAAAAHLASTATAEEPRPGQWIYYKTAGYSYPPAAVTTNEEWITFDGSKTAYYSGGRLIVRASLSGPSSPGANPWGAWSAAATPKTAYDVLTSLPANPRALLAVIARHAADQNAQNIAAGNPIAGIAAKTEAQREFDYLTLILWNAAPGGGPAAAEASAFRALATLPGITVQQGIRDTAGGQAIGVSDDGGYDQLLIDPVSYQVIGIRLLSTGTSGMVSARALIAGHLPPGLAGMTKAERAATPVASAVRRHEPVPARGTLIQEIVYARNARVPAPGDR